MGASSSRDVETSRTTEGGENARIKYAAASMQGFGIEMEDAVSNLLF
jgi:protein phosphatase 1G